MDRLRAMEVFVRVVDAGSFTAAARAMKISRTSTTSEVQGLEAHLGVQLLRRTTRSVTLTHEGASYYEEVRRVLGDLAEIETSMGQAKAGPRGRIRIDVPAAIGRGIIAPAMPTFAARHPEIQVEIGSTDRIVDLVAEGVDCVVRAGRLRDDSLVGRVLHEQPVVTCAAPSYLAAHGTPQSPADLDGHRFVGFISGRNGRVVALNWQPANDSADAAVLRNPPYVYASTDADTWIALAVAGLGIIQTPCLPAIRARIASGELSLIMPGWRSEPITESVLYPAARYLPSRVRLFIDWLVTVYAAEGEAAARFIAEIAQKETHRVSKTRKGPSR